MQQQQLAAQLAHHGGSTRPPPLSPTPSDSDSDISLGTHSPPISSPGPIRFGASSPTPITTFRFGPHSPGPMPPQFRFGNHTPPNFRLDKRSPTPGAFGKLSRESPINMDAGATGYGLRLTGDVVDTISEKEIRVDDSPSRPHSPPMNLRMSHPGDHMRLQPETPMPLRLGGAPQITTPLRIQVASPSKMVASPSPQTNLHLGVPAHGGIVRIAPPSPPKAPVLHRPFSPARLT